MVGLQIGADGLIGTVVGFMDDVFGIYAVGNGAEELRSSSRRRGAGQGRRPQIWQCHVAEGLTWAEGWTHQHNGNLI